MQTLKGKIPELLTMLFAGICAAFILDYSLKYNAAFDTDAADHANAALDVYHGLKNLDPRETLGAIFKQAFYPPVHSIITALSYLLVGANATGAILPSIAGFWLSAVLLTYLVKNFYFKGDNSLYAIFCSILPAILLITAPVNFFNAGLCMMEQVSLTLFIISLIILSKINKDSSPSLIIMLAISLTVTALSKYTVMAALLPAALISMLFALKERIVNFHKFIIGTLIIISVLTIWFTNIHFKSVTDFIFNQPPLKDGFWSYKNFIYYPKSFFYSQVINPLAALIVLILAFTGAIKRIKNLPFFFCITLLLWSLIIFTITSEKGGRHILFLMPAILFLIPAGFDTLGCKKLQIILLSMIYLLLGFGTYNQTFIYKKQFSRKFESPKNSADLIRHIAENTIEGKSVLIIGLNDSLSLEGLRWQTALTKNTRYRDVTVDSFPFHPGTRDLAISHQRNLAKPWKDSSIPKKPLIKVLKSSAYDYFVILKTPNYFAYKTKHLNSDAAKEIDEFLIKKTSSARKISKKLPEVIIYDLR